MSKFAGVGITNALMLFILFIILIVGTKTLAAHYNLGGLSTILLAV